MRVWCVLGARVLGAIIGVYGIYTFIGIRMRVWCVVGARVLCLVGVYGRGD